MNFLKTNLRYLLAIVITTLVIRSTFHFYWLRTGSMAPELPAGSLIVTSMLLAPSDGSVCAYRHNGNIIVHRIVGENENGFIFKGDANNVEDPYTVSISEIDGRMIIGIPPLL
ncbi:MAG: S24/S26 family peptidase [Eubacteriales bacterium]|nr:S24/S26 family peptidase [Eubacteriales bacterium]